MTTTCFSGPGSWAAANSTTSKTSARSLPPSTFILRRGKDGYQEHTGGCVCVYVCVGGGEGEKGGGVRRGAQHVFRFAATLPIHPAVEGEGADGCSQRGGWGQLQRDSVVLSRGRPLLAHSPPEECPTLPTHPPTHPLALAAPSLTILTSAQLPAGCTESPG